MRYRIDTDILARLHSLEGSLFLHGNRLWVFRSFKTETVVERNWLRKEVTRIYLTDLEIVGRNTDLNVLRHFEVPIFDFIFGIRTDRKNWNIVKEDLKALGFEIVKIEKNEKTEASAESK